MHATIRRYEGVDMTRTNEVTSKIKQTLVPQLRKLGDGHFVACHWAEKIKAGELEPIESTPVEPERQDPVEAPAS